MRAVFLVSLGVGYSRGQDDEWIDHQQSFDQILASLNAENKDDEISKCLSHAITPTSLTSYTVSLLHSGRPSWW